MTVFARLLAVAAGVLMLAGCAGGFDAGSGGAPGSANSSQPVSGK